MTTTGLAPSSPDGALGRVALQRRELRDDDVAIRVDFCGVCHSDLHALRAWTPQSPGLLVPGHEFTGVVLATGDAVSRSRRVTGSPSATSSTPAATARCADVARRTSATSPPR